MDENVVVQEATVEDRIVLWDWRNDPATRKIYNGSPSVTYGQHRQWFDRILGAENTVLCVGIVETLRIGCVRFDLRDDGEYEVYVHIKPHYCGRGLGRLLLKGAIDHLGKTRSVSKIHAHIKKANPSSGNLFRSTGFQVRESEDELHCELSL